MQSSVTDVTDKVADGKLDYTFAAGNGNPWVLIDLIQTASGLIAQRGGYTATQPNYVPDHWNRGGVQIQADFWDKSGTSRCACGNHRRVRAVAGRRDKSAMRRRSAHAL